MFGYFLRALLLLLPACAAQVQIGPAAPDPEPSVIGTGPAPANLIEIVRPSEAGLLTTVAARPVVTLGGREVGRCAVGRPILLRVPDGTHVVAAETPAGRTERAVTVAGGGTERLTCGVAGGLAPRPVLTPG